MPSRHRSAQQTPSDTIEGDQVELPLHAAQRIVTGANVRNHLATESRRVAQERPEIVAMLG